MIEGPLRQTMPCHANFTSMQTVNVPGSLHFSAPYTLEVHLLTLSIIEFVKALRFCFMYLVSLSSGDSDCRI